MLKYVTLMHLLEQLITEDPYKDGQRLPSIRTLKVLYPGYSTNTILRALSELEQRHIIYSVPKSGYYVVKSHKPKYSPPTGLIDFSSSSPDPNLFPYMDFQHCINKAIDIYREDLFIYGTSQGLPSLIDVMKQQLTQYQVFTSSNNIFIVSGVQQALSLLSSLKFPNSKEKILIEQPGYHLFIHYLKENNIPTLGIRRSPQGLDLNELEHIFRTEDIKFFYTMPRFHNPLGSSYSKEHKLDILALARKYNVYIVEDDFLADLDTTNNDPMYSYDQDGIVIYLKSYSKIIFPGLRIGIAVIPDPLRDGFKQLKLVHDIDSSMLSQGALEIYLKSGMFDNHKQKIIQSYSARSKVLHASLASVAGQNVNMTYNPPLVPCIHTCIQINKDISPGGVRAKLDKHSVKIDLMDQQYLPSFTRDSMIKLNVSRVAESDIPRGIELLMKHLK